MGDRVCLLHDDQNWDHSHSARQRTKCFADDAPECAPGIACFHGVSRHRGSRDEIADFDRSQVSIDLAKGLSQQRNGNSSVAGSFVEHDCRLVLAGS